MNNVSLVKEASHYQSPITSPSVSTKWSTLGVVHNLTNNKINLDSTSQGDNNNPRTCYQKLKDLYDRETLLIEVFVVIFLAYIYPPLGAYYLFPEITAHWIAVIAIFFLSGFALKLTELGVAAKNTKFNAFVILFNFLCISSVVKYVAKYFYHAKLISEDLMKGMVICSCLSMPTNLMVVLTVSSKGDPATALFLATVMNLMGVFVTPLLIFFYLGEDSEIDFLKTYRSIGMRVLLPVSLGLSMRKTLSGADAFAEENIRLFARIRELCLVFVVYATFCNSFINESEAGSQIIFMAAAQIILLISALIIAWILLFIFFNKQPKLRVTGFFGCCTKTAALGIPLITAIYEDHPRLRIYTMPLLVWYPAQLIIGTILSSSLARFVDKKFEKYENERRKNSYHLHACGIEISEDLFDSKCLGLNCNSEMMQGY